MIQDPTTCTFCDTDRVDLVEVYLRRSGSRIPKPWRRMCEACKAVAFSAGILSTVRVADPFKINATKNVLAIMGGDKAAGYFLQLRETAKKAIGKNEKD